jgi:hypothetical protein
MAIDLDELQSDIAQIQHDGKIERFGSGRLIAKNLILTAAHILAEDTNTENSYIRDGWKVRLVKDRKSLKEWPWRQNTEIVWYNLDIDLALIKIENPSDLADRPSLPLRVATVTTNAREAVEARGFPRASKTSEAPRTQTPVRGFISTTDIFHPLRLGVEQSDLPNSPRENWHGMSGSAVTFVGDQGSRTLWIYGVVKKVPANYDGILDVSRLADAWIIPGFRTLLVDAEAPDEDADDPSTECFTTWRRHLELEFRTLEKDANAISPNLLPVPSPLEKYVSKLISDKPWNERIRDAFINTLGTTQRHGDGVQPDADSLILTGNKQIEAVNFRGEFPEIETKVLKIADTIIREANILRERNRSRSRGKASDTQSTRTTKALRQLAGRLDRFKKNWCDKGSYSRCLVVLGTFGSGRTALLQSYLRRWFNPDRPSKTTTWIIKLTTRIIELEHSIDSRLAADWVLDEVKRVTERAWTDLASFDQYMCKRGLHVLFIFDDFERVVRQQPQLAASIRNLVENTTNYTSFRWVFLALDTSYAGLTNFIPFFKKYGISPYDPDDWHETSKPTACFVDGAFMIDPLNDDVKTGLKIIRENCPDNELWKQTLAEIDQRTASRLSSPLIAVIAIAEQDKSRARPITTQHYISFIEKLWEHRCEHLLPKQSDEQRLRIRNIMLSLCDLMREKRTVTPALADAAEKLANFSVGGSLGGLDILSQLSLIHLPKTSPLAPIGKNCTISLITDIIWHEIMATAIFKSLEVNTHAETEILRWLEAIPDSSFREGTWQLFLLHTDRYDQKLCNAWLDFTLHVLTATKNTEFPALVSAEAALFAAAFASDDAAEHVAASLISMEVRNLERREVFAILYFAFSSSGISLGTRCEIAAKFAREIARWKLDRYFGYQVAKAVETEDDIQVLFEGLHALSGIEILQSCADIVGIVCASIIEIIDIDLKESNVDDDMSYVLNLIISYLDGETENAASEYKFHRDTKPRGTPYFVREHFLHFLLDYALERQISARSAFDTLEDTGWYNGACLAAQGNIATKDIAAEMRREANLAFGRWYRNADHHRYRSKCRAVAESYCALISELVRDATAGASEHGEAAFFLLRHTAVPSEHHNVIGSGRPDERIIGREFAQSIRELKRCGAALRRRFVDYPIKVDGS